MSVPDPYLILLNTFAIFAAYAYFVEKKFSWLLVSAISLGLGTLAKGPVSIALPGASVFLWLLWERKLKEIFSWKILLAGVIMIGIALPWYIAVHYATDGEWTRGFFLENNLGRFSAPMEGHGGPFIIVPLFVLVGLLPFSVFIGEALRNFKAQFGSLPSSSGLPTFERKEEGNKTFMRLALCVTVIFIVFYSISGTKLPNYPMPCYPFVAGVLGSYLAGAFKEQARVRVYPFIVLLIINLAIPIAIYFALKNEQELQGLEKFSFFMLLLTLAASMAIYFSRKDFRKAVTAMFGVYTVFNILFFVWFYPMVYLNNPMSKTIDTVRKYKNVIAFDLFQPSFTFYLPERVKVFTNVDSIGSYLQTNDAVVLVREANAGQLEKLNLKKLASRHDLFESSTTVILTNKELQ
jgi:4-amino-4-deoxy-L-arabinose transferase-like glycosyltransferase